MFSIRTFPTKKLTQDEIIKLFLAIANYCEEANIAALSVLLNQFRNKVNILQSMIHVVMGSELTPELLVLDNERDEYTIGFRYYNEFALRHYDPQKRKAAVEIAKVLNTTSYKGIYDDAYDRETNKITNLIQELNNHSEAISILGIGDYVQALDNTNQAFDTLYQKRMKKTARTYTSTEILEARNEMEKAYDLLRLKLLTLAAEAELSGNTSLSPMPISGGAGTTTGGMGGGTGTGMGGTGTGTTDPLPYSYEELFSFINNHITHEVNAAEERLAAIKRAKEAKENEANNGGNSANSNNGENNNSSNNGENTNTTPENNNENGNGENGVDNNGGENTNTDNTDPNQGDDNTPSANA